MKNPSASPMYVFLERQLTLLGDRDPIAVLGGTPERLRAIVGQHSEAVFRATAFPGKWTPNEILAHLTDMEWVFGFRARTILGDERPVLTGVDQDRWVAAQRGAERRPRDLAEAFAALRAINLAFWRSLTDQELDRAGYHAEAKYELSLGLWRRIQAGHDLRHLEQLGEYLGQITSSSPPASAPA